MRARRGGVILEVIGRGGAMRNMRRGKWDRP